LCHRPPLLPLLLLLLLLFVVGLLLLLLLREVLCAWDSPIRSCWVMALVLPLACVQFGSFVFYF